MKPVNRLIPPFHQGNGRDGAIFDLFMTNWVYPGDVINNQKTDLYVSGITHVDEDFIEEYCIAKVQLVHNNQDVFFEMKDLSDLEVFRLYATTNK